MFENPLALAVLLLALPWWWWSRRRRPRTWVVGGLEPFRDLPRGPGGRRRTPPSTWVGLAALLCATLALAGPRRPAPPLAVLDGSFSTVACLPAGRDPADLLPAWARSAVRARLGDPGTPVAEAEILAALRRNRAGGRRTVVVSDRPEPLGLPPGVHWLRPPGAETRRRAAILAVWPEGGGDLAVHWVAWGLDSAPVLRLRGPDGAERRWELEGREGVARVPAAGGPGTLELLHPELPGPAAAPAWQRWELPAPPVVRLPATAAPAWEAALAALFPGARVHRGGEAGAGDLVVAFGSGGPDTALRWPADPFRELGPREAAAAVAAVLEPRREAWWGRPRLRAECAPDLRPRDWREEPWPAAPPGRGNTPARILAGGGLLLYLASLVLRRRGR